MSAPFRSCDHKDKTPLSVVGPVVVGLGLILFALCVRKFRKAGTGIGAGDPTTVTLTSGPYRWGRNPIYLSMIFFLAGLAASPAPRAKSPSA